ncbi:hypothetical protein SUGI_0723620 [Cryptomeria japonica]|nr:hypothetical protein SUGI_0723620 [Cryptomeria japonica]
MGRNGLLTDTIVAFALALLLNECNSAALDTLYLGASLTRSQTIKSRNGSFELGFFSPSGTNNWYMGIWSLPRKKVVWVANRENPVRKKTGVLRLSRDGYLGLFRRKGASVWSANVSQAASNAVITDSGNFVLMAANKKSKTLWQSFDHPGNTWLPGMKLGKDKKLVSWKNSLDPAPGIFSFQADTSRDNQFVLISNNTMVYWRSEWVDNMIAEIPPFFNVKFNLENSSSGIYSTYTPTVDYLLGFSLRTYGVLGEDYYDEHNRVEVEAPSNCPVYNLCGPYGICENRRVRQIDWKPRNNDPWDSHEWWSSGCVFDGRSDCDSLNGSTVGFSTTYNIWVPDTGSAPYPAPTREACEDVCLRNCSCVAYSFEPCQFWFQDVFNTDNLVVKDGLQLRLPDGPASGSSQYNGRDPGVVLLIAISSIGALVIALFFIIKTWCWRRHRLRSTQRFADSSDAFLRTFSYKELKTATRNFRCKLGSGGFGLVFKGALTDGTLVAVKKLEGSKQSEKQFRAEINYVGNIHHANLVRLRGFCAKGSRRLLVFDYMPNGSLNSFLFTTASKSPPKVDVYSFGMTLLEIISGRRNLHLTVQESSKYYFPSWAEEQICQGNMISIVDERIANNADVIPTVMTNQRVDRRNSDSDSDSESCIV